MQPLAICGQKLSRLISELGVVTLLLSEVMGDIAEAFEEIKHRTLVGLQVAFYFSHSRLLIIYPPALRPVTDPVGSRNWTDAMYIYNARIVEIARTAREVVAFLQSKRNSFSSLFRLPPELICEIVLCLNMNGRLRFSWISSYLRQICLARPYIWADLDFSCHSPFLLRCLLNRAANSPLTLRQGVSLHTNPMRSVTRPTRYSKYEYTDHRLSFPLEWQPSTILERTEELNLSSSFAMYTSPLEFITSSCFEQPMPLLVTLKLRAATLSCKPPAGPRNEGHWFAGKTPRLRHISFHRLSAPWHDPIYKNLISLALHYPSQPISPVELVYILSKSPMLQELTLQGALMEDGLEESPPSAYLPHLQRMHVEINQSGFDRNGGSRTIRLFLSLIRPGPHCKLHIETNDLGAFPSPTPERSWSCILQHTDTIRIAAVRNRIEFHGCRDSDVFWSYIATDETVLPGGFDVPDFHSPAMLSGLSHIADTARMPWDKVTTLSVAIADRAVESIGTRLQGLAGLNPPYHNFFARLFGRCINLRSLSLSTTNPTTILVNALSASCRTLTEISIDGNIKDPILLSLWVEERCSHPRQCDKITKLLVKHRDDIGGGENLLPDYEDLLDAAKTRFTSTVPEFGWQTLQPEHRDAMLWQDPSWDDYEFLP